LRDIQNLQKPHDQSNVNGTKLECLVIELQNNNGEEVIVDAQFCKASRNYIYVLSLKRFYVVNLQPLMHLDAQGTNEHNYLEMISEQAIELELQYEDENYKHVECQHFI